MTSVSQARPFRKAVGSPLAAALGLSLLLHLLGSLVFRAASVKPGRPLPSPPLVTFLSPTADEASIRDFRTKIALADPSHSSLPGPNGFSKTTIERYPQVPSLIETRQDNPQWLTREAFDLAQLAIVPETPLAASLSAYASKQPPFFADEDKVEFTVPPKPESTFLLGGAIRGRKLVTLVNIPLVRSPAPAQPTVVRIAVSPIGEVKFAVVEKSSGSEEKDARALEIIRRWRFQTVDEQVGDQWGTVSVYWAAELPAPPVPAPAETNAPAKDEGSAE
jgi:TonB family protein